MECLGKNGRNAQDLLEEKSESPGKWKDTVLSDRKPRDYKGVNSL